VQLDIDISGIEELKRLNLFLDRKTIDKALLAGTRYAGKATPPAAAQQIVRRYNIKSARVKQDIRGPYVRGGFENPEARIFFARRPPSAVQWGGVDQDMPGKGLSVKILKAKPRIQVARGFMRRAPGGGFRVPPQPFRRTTKNRYPLAYVYGPSIGSIFAGDSAHGEEIRDAVGKRIEEQYIKGIERALGAAARGFG
jgi:hypothetical protein